MNKKTLEIRILGQAGSGKSQMIMLLCKFLESQNFEIDYQDPDMNKIKYNKFYEVKQELAKKVKIVLTSKQTKRI